MTFENHELCLELIWGMSELVKLYEFNKRHSKSS
jgi:hypothetical protein